MAAKFFLTALLFASTNVGAAADAAGRWEGVADVPGHPLRVIVDLDRDADGRWAGSAILPGRGVKGAPLESLVVADGKVSFGLAGAFLGGDTLKPRLTLAREPDGSMAGRFALGGQEAGVRLRRSGPAQVDRPPASSVLGAALAGRWTGRYELGGVAREVTLTLANGPDGRGGGQLVIVGKRTTTLQVDEVTQGREFVTLRAGAADFRIEGRFAPDAGVIDGAMAQGPFEAPLVLRKSS